MKRKRKLKNICDECRYFEKYKIYTGTCTLRQILKSTHSTCIKFEKSCSPAKGEEPELERGGSVKAPALSFLKEKLQWDKKKY